MCLKDMKVFTSLLDARYITGSKKLFEIFRNDYITQILAKRGRAFLSEMIRMRKLRTQRQGDSVYVLEPDLKDGRGGLRDYHTSLWLLKTAYAAQKFSELAGRGLIKQSTIKNFSKALDYVFDLRHRLHFLSLRRNERLIFEYQRKIALEKRYTEKRHSTSTELMMSDYYRSAEIVDSFCDLMMNKISENTGNESTQTVKRIDGVFGKKDRFLIATAEKKFVKNTANIVRAFCISKKMNLGLHDYLKEMIEESVKSKNIIKLDMQALSDFKSMFKNLSNLYETLVRMNRLGVLIKLIPEFKSIRARVQHDVYHAYTVDAHSLMAIKELQGLESKKYKNDFSFLTDLVCSLTPHDFVTLSFAVLLHDIGKGKGVDHSLAGSKIADKVCLRLGFKQKERENIVFLVKNHLLMPITSQRRNLDDPVMLNNFVSEVGNTRRLKLLYLLTFADLRSVADKGKAFTAWKNLLLKDLYDKAIDHLSLGKYRKWIFGKEIKSLKRLMISKISSNSKKKDFRRFINSFPESYFRSFSEMDIEKHFQMVSGVKSEGFSCDFKVIPDYEISKITVCMKDFTGLFSVLTGAFSASKINILSALIFSSDEGYAIDSFLAEGVEEVKLSPEGRQWKDFNNLLKISIESREKFLKIISSKLKKRRSILDSIKPFKKPDIRFDNDSSGDFSILEVYAEDRLGLLYDIASVLTSIGLRIHFAKISTVGNRAQDIFYLTDLKGKKIKNKSELNAVQSKTLNILSV